MSTFRPAAPAPAAAASAAGTPYALRSLRLYLARRIQALGTFVLIVIGCAAATLLIALLIGIRTGLPLPAQVSAGFHTNIAVIWAVPGFFVVTGALSVNRTFATALAWGSTRRDFWLGITVGFAISAAVMALTAGACALLEEVTGGWGIGAYAFSMRDLVESPAQAMLLIFLLAFTSALLGAMFGTVYRAFGMAATAAAGVGLGLLLIAVAAVCAWQWDAIGPQVMTRIPWVPVVVVGALALIGLLGSLVANRRATV